MIEVVVLVGTTICTSKNAFVDASNPPTRAAAPAFVVPEASTLNGLVYPDETDVVVSNAVVPLLLFWVIAGNVQVA